MLVILACAVSCVVNVGLVVLGVLVGSVFDLRFDLRLGCYRICCLAVLFGMSGCLIVLM